MNWKAYIVAILVGFFSFGIWNYYEMESTLISAALFGLLSTSAYFVADKFC